LTLWNTQAQQYNNIKQGDIIDISNCRVKEFNGRTQLECMEGRSTINIVEEEKKASSFLF